MTSHSLNNISPVDGRYRRQTKELANYFSEYALFRYRVFVEVEYFFSLCEIPLPQLEKFPKSKYSALKNIYKKFSLDDAKKIKKIEKKTNHDVKAVEYFIKEKMKKNGLADYVEFIHFGLTSQDINNTSIPLLLKDANEHIVFPLMNETLIKLKKLSSSWQNIPMLAHTHGQPASPTRLGKEIFVFVERIEKQLDLLKQIPYSAKFSGATGNFNAHHIAYPDIVWKKFADKFVNEKLGLSRSQTTTQIEHYDNLAAMCDAFKRINTILIDLNRDMWTYISTEYFKQKIKEGEVGSSAMPHKVNPIDFENSEGNLGVANAIFEHFSAKLPISRLQRDLTDSTVLRNIGVPFAHTVIALKSLLKGLEKILVNEKKISDDLEKNWAVVAEAIQTILRREGYPKPYETLKNLTRINSVITQKSIFEFVDSLHISEEIKAELKKISPKNYTGI